MAQNPTLPYGHVTVPGDILATALYGLGQYEAAEIEHRGDGLRPSTKVCQAVGWFVENDRLSEVTNLVGTVCAILRGRPVPGGVGRITHDDVIAAFGAEVSKMGLLSESQWAPVAEHLTREVPRGF
ncbi:hypothetical protein [Streptomyces sp. NPDC101455]|uniref:hypothetical protein n=1 Tax=Streptomyces sp. NPDC101455 TaxID=3366142 RepID=UPI003806222C